jgi:hypothetical protein
MPKHFELLKVDGCKWEAAGAGAWCLDVKVNEDLVCVWSYPDNNDYLVVNYRANEFSGADSEQWLGPLETLCVIEEALKKASSTAKNTSSDT